MSDRYLRLRFDDDGDVVAGLRTEPLAVTEGLLRRGWAVGACAETFGETSGRRLGGVRRPARNGQCDALNT